MLKLKSERLRRELIQIKSLNLVLTLERVDCLTLIPFTSIPSASKPVKRKKKEPVKSKVLYTAPFVVESRRQVKSSVQPMELNLVNNY